MVLADYGDWLRQDLMARDGTVDEDNVKLLNSITSLRSKTNLQLPEIERTILKLSRQPKEGTLWARLLQRVAGWAMGLTQVLFTFLTAGKNSAQCCK
jgi:hypothetical protein